MKGIVFYQDIDSGSKVATEALLKELTTQYPHIKFSVYKQNPRFYLGAFAFLRNLFWSVRDFRSQLNQQAELDIVYSAMYTSALGQLFSRHRQVPLVLHLHGDQRFGSYRSRLPWKGLDPRFWYASLVGKGVLLLQMWAVVFARKVIFVSQKARDEFLHRYQLHNLAHKTTILINGVDVNHYYPVSATIQRQLLKQYRLKTPVLVYIGRMDEKKGVHLLLEALTYLRHQPLTVIIAYPKPTDSYAQAYLDQLRTQARQTAAPHHQLHFWQNPTNLAELYQVATMAILPSQQEMMPLVMLEALASGTPFLVPEVGGVLEILHPLKKQALLASTSPVSLARKIKWVLNLPASRKQHWKKTARRIAVQYTWEAQARKLLAILESVTSARPATRRQ